MITQNDFLIGGEFRTKPLAKNATNIFQFCFGGKKGLVKNGDARFPILEIHKESFCIDYNGAPRSIEFSDCKLIEDNE